MSSYQGNLGTIKAAVIDTLRLEESDDTARVTEWVNLAYQQAVQETGCLQRVGTANLTAGTSTYDLPANVAWIKSLRVTYQDGSTTDPLRQVPQETIDIQRRVTVAAGQAVVRPMYALAGQNQLELWPEPGAGQSMTFRYVYLPEQLVADGDEPAIMEPYGTKLLETGALVEGARFKKDPLLPDYEATYQMWLARFQQFLNRREGDGPRTFRVVGIRSGVRVFDRSADVA